MGGRLSILLQKLQTLVPLIIIPLKVSRLLSGVNNSIISPTSATSWTCVNLSNTCDVDGVEKCASLLSINAISSLLCHVKVCITVTSM